MSGFRSVRALRALRSSAAALRLTASGTSGASALLRSGLLAQRLRVTRQTATASPLASWMSTHSAKGAGRAVGGGGSYQRHPSHDRHAPIATSATVGQPSAHSGEAKPFKSVFGVEDIVAAPTTSATSSAAAAAAEAAASAAPSLSAAGVKAQPVVSQSPSAAFQPAAYSALPATPATPATASGSGSGGDKGGATFGPDGQVIAPPKKGVRELLRQYGMVWGATYAGLYVGTLFSLYGLVQSGVLGGQDAIDLLQSTGLDKTFGINVEELNPKHGNFAVAWVATKFTEPIRLALSIGITPRIARIPAIARFLPKQTPAPAQPSDADKAAGRAQ